MQPLAHSVQGDLLKRAWQSFLKIGQVETSTQEELAPYVCRSWRRCAPLLDPRARPRPAVLGEQALARVLATHVNLLSIARPFMEDIHQFAEGSGFAVLLVDGAACMLEILGDQPIVERLNRHGMRLGAYWDEGHMGTNAVALALLEAVPIQITGPEHYFQVLHDFTCSAAPIHDVSGRIVGVVAMAGCQENCCAHTLAAVMAAARAIGNQLQIESYLNEINYRLTELNSVFGAISEGIVSWNQEGKVTHINAQAGEILDVKPQFAMGRLLKESLELPPIIAEAINKGESLRDVETGFSVNGRFVDCLVSLQPVFEGGGSQVGYIATLRPIERVHRLVHRLVGAQAALTLEDIQGDSAKIRQVRRYVRTAARGVAPVLLCGEDGVGKNPLARAIHNESARAEKPFIAINCQALPHELMLSEFLGCESGAFSGALAEGRPSKFELADGGTLFLDEVESLSLEMQAVLLQVIDTGYVMRLGGARLIPVNVRIIAATAVNLGQRVVEGNFSPDLYRRLGVFRIDLPPLRERVEDLPLLIERFLARVTQRLECAAFISDEALEVMCRYPWPGNIRELENVLERAVAASTDGIIRVQDLPAAVRSERAMPPGALRPKPVLTVAEAEREAIVRAGWACRGQATAMAELLGIGRTTLWRKMKALDIDLGDFKQRQQGISH